MNSKIWTKCSILSHYNMKQAVCILFCSSQLVFPVESCNSLQSRSSQTCTKSLHFQPLLLPVPVESCNSLQSRSCADQSDGFEGSHLQPVPSSKGQWFFALLRCEHAVTNSLRLSLLCTLCLRATFCLQLLHSQWWWSEVVAAVYCVVSIRCKCAVWKS